MLAERVAWLLFQYEDTFQRIQRSYFERLYARGVTVKGMADVAGSIEIFMPRRDKARVLAVFYDDAGGIHIVWDDEYVPFPGVDRAYREIRRREYGRTADVESVHVEGGKVKFVTTYGPPNVYETSMHNDGEAPLRLPLRIYVWTWNHMMHVQPSPDVQLRFGYRRETGFTVRRGTRRDAEEYARRVTGSG